mmetsp:Transcript_14890/g.30290  ORF Transcript_14890/g.30290 Transcript_14890/m.30290 type:complete len:210 (+) Transcript_14890:936-1565(+)
MSDRELCMDSCESGASHKMMLIFFAYRRSWRTKFAGFWSWWNEFLGNLVLTSWKLCCLRGRRSLLGPMRYGQRLQSLSRRHCKPKDGPSRSTKEEVLSTGQRSTSRFATQSAVSGSVLPSSAILTCPNDLIWSMCPVTDLGNDQSWSTEPSLGQSRDFSEYSWKATRESFPCGWLLCRCVFSPWLTAAWIIATKLQDEPRNWVSEWRWT